MSEYADRDHAAQGEHYVRHVSAMTAEGLHAKSAIAAELAHRDIEIAALRQRLEEAEAELGRMEARAVSAETEIVSLRQRAEGAEARLAWIERWLFEHKWNGVIDSGSRTDWQIAGNFRHITAKMVGTTFEAAIDAARKETP